MPEQTEKKDSKLQIILKEELKKWPSKVAMAAKLGISDEYLSQLLTGKRTGERIKFDIAKKLGIDPLYLLETHGITLMPKDWLRREMELPVYTVSEFMARYGTESEMTPGGWPRRPGVKKDDQVRIDVVDDLDL